MKTVFKSFYKKSGGCQFEIFQPTRAPYRESGIVNYRICGEKCACQAPAAGKINGIPLCKSHYDYARFYAGIK